MQAGHPRPTLQELPDWRGMDTEGGKLHSTSKEKYKQRLVEFLCDKLEQKKRVTVPKLLQTRLANKWALIATDAALASGVGGSMQSFIDDAPCRPLQPGEVRYLLDVAEMDEEMRAASPGRRYRSCIFSDGTGETRLEVIWGSAKKALVQHTDMGSATFNGKVWLWGPSSVHCRGWCFPDPTHRRFNNFGLALERSQLGFLKHESLCVTNLGNAPWSGSGHFGKYSDAAHEYKDNYDCADPLFQATYSAIAFDLSDGFLTPEVGSQEHMREVFDMLVSSDLWEKKGETAKGRRWFQTTRRWEDKSRQMSMLLHMLLYIGMHLGWWKSLKESPLGPLLQGTGAEAGQLLDDDGEPRLAADEPARERHGVATPAAVGHVGPDTVAGSSKQADKATSDKNGCFLAAAILGNLVHLALQHAVGAITRVVDDQHGLLLTSSKTVRGCVAINVERASGEWPYLAAMVGLLRDHKLLVRMGLVSCSDTARPGRPFAEPELLQVSQSMTDFLRHFLGLELADNLCCHLLFPGAFARLLSERHREGGLRHARKTWEAVCSAEASGDLWVVTFARQLLWPGNPWIRELFVALLEADFASLPCDLEATLLEMFADLGTKLIEDAFGQLRLAMRTSGKGHLGPVAQWHALTHGGLLEESGRAPVLPTRGDHVGVKNRQLPATTFQARPRKFCLGSAVLKEYMAPKAGDVTVSGDRYQKLPLQHSALLWCESDWGKLKLVWLSQLFVPGSLVCRESDLLDSDAFWVLANGSAGAYAWRVKLHDFGGRLSECEYRTWLHLACGSMGIAKAKVCGISSEPHFGMLKHLRAARMYSPAAAPAMCLCNPHREPVKMRRCSKVAGLC